MATSVAQGPEHLLTTKNMQPTIFIHKSIMVSLADHEKHYSELIEYRRYQMLAGEIIHGTKLR
jgi:hypothetical protein